MAGELLIGIDLSRPEGERLASEVIAEIEKVAPSTVNDGDITTPKLANNAVTDPKIAPGAVKSPHIATGEVKNVNLGTNAVTTTKIQDGAVTPDKTGPGILTIFDAAGNPIEIKAFVMSFAEFGDIDPEAAIYFLTP